MNNYNKLIILLVITIVILTALLIAIFVSNDEIIKKRGESDEMVEEKISELIIDDCTDEYEEYNENTISTNSEEEKISPNCKIILTRYYKECKDYINEYIQIPKNLVNLTQKDLQSQYKDWEIKEFSSNRINLYKEFEGTCGEHYILRDEEEKIAIYKLNENGEEVLYEKTDIPINYLPEKDRISINNGLKINGKENLNKLIENFE